MLPWGGFQWKFPHLHLILHCTDELPGFRAKIAIQDGAASHETHTLHWLHYLTPITNVNPFYCFRRPREERRSFESPRRFGVRKQSNNNQPQLMSDVVKVERGFRLVIRTEGANKRTSEPARQPRKRSCAVEIDSIPDFRRRRQVDSFLSILLLSETYYDV